MPEEGPHLTLTITKSERGKAANDSRFRKVTAEVEGRNRTLMVWETKLFDDIDDAAERQTQLEVVLGHTEKSSNYIVKIIGPAAAPPPQPSNGHPQPDAGGGKFWTPRPWHPEDRVYDLRKTALDNATAINIELLRGVEAATLSDLTGDVIATAKRFEDDYLRRDLAESGQGGAATSAGASSASSDGDLHRQLRAQAGRLKWTDDELTDWYRGTPSGKGGVRFQDTSEAVQRAPVALLRDKADEEAGGPA